MYEHITKIIEKELQDAEKNHGKFKSLFDGAWILQEEKDEVINELQKIHSNYNLGKFSYFFKQFQYEFGKQYGQIKNAVYKIKFQNLIGKKQAISLKIELIQLAAMCFKLIEFLESENDVR